jgi:hypothetical protein
MAIEFKVWIVVEEYDTTRECGEDVDLMFGSKRTFRKLQPAVDFATALQETPVLAWRGRGRKVKEV